jgi:hypothetical protein
MKTIIKPIRVRALEGTVRVIGRVLAACARALPAVGVSRQDIDAVLHDGVAIEHPDTFTERLLVLQILDSPGPRSRAELEIELSDIAPLTIGHALEALEAEDVLRIAGEHVWACRSARHLDDLGFIAI